MCVLLVFQNKEGVLLVSVYPLTKHHTDSKASIVHQKVQSVSWSLVHG